MPHIDIIEPESGWSWGNNEYDPAYVGCTEFLRGGDPAWARWAADSARHLADVDTINFSSGGSQIGGQAMKPSTLQSVRPSSGSYRISDLNL